MKDIKKGETFKVSPFLLHEILVGNQSILLYLHSFVKNRIID